MKIKRYISATLCFLMAVMLSSCSHDQGDAEKTPVVSLPNPSDKQIQMILGEQIVPEPETVTLYYVSGDGTSFTTVTRSMLVTPEESIFEEIVNTLLSGVSSPERTDYIPIDTQLLGVEYTNSIVTIHLSLDALSSQSEQEHLMLLAALSNSMLSAEDVSSVNILIDGRSEAMAGLPIGVRSAPYAGITPSYAQINAERDYFLESETGTITRNAVLYFPDANGVYFIPELREITFDSSNYAATLIRALRTGPQKNTCAVSAIPEGIDLLVNNPAIETRSSGERVLCLDFSESLLDYLAFSGLEERQLIGSIVLTTTSFVPEIDAVRISISETSENTEDIPAPEYAFTDKLLRRKDYSSAIGSAVELYVPNENGTLDNVERACSMLSAQSPLGLLNALFNEIAESGSSLHAFQEDIFTDDLLGVSVENGIACVNLSADFYRKSQMLDATAERSVIYAIVNTLCELREINGVRFYIEGISTETLSGNIYLKGVLLPNPGIVATKQTVSSSATESP